MRWYQVSHLISCSREAHNFLARDMYYLRWSKLVSMFDICSINLQSSIISICVCVCVGHWTKKNNSQPTAWAMLLVRPLAASWEKLKTWQNQIEPNFIQIEIEPNRMAFWMLSNAFRFWFISAHCTWHLGSSKASSIIQATLRENSHQRGLAAVNISNDLAVQLDSRVPWCLAFPKIGLSASLCSWEAATVTSFMCSSTQSSVMSSILGEKHNSWIMDQILFEAISLELWWLPVPSLECMIIIMSDRHRWFIEFCFIWPALDWQSMQARIRTLQKAQPKIFLSSVATSSSSEVERSMSLCNSFW